MLYEESLTLRRQLGDRRGIASSLNNLGNVPEARGDYQAAHSLHEESLVLKRELEDRPGVASSLHNLGNVAQKQGDYQTARSLHEESLAMKRELGDKRGVAYSLDGLGNIALEQGDYQAARSLHEECLARRRELGDKLGIAASIAGLAGVAAGMAASEGTEEIRRGIASRGARLLGAVEEQLEAIGAVLDGGDRILYERSVASVRAQLGGEATFNEAWADGEAMSMEAAINYALEEY